MPVMSRDCTIYAKNEDEAWEIYYGNQKGKIQFHEPEYSDINDYDEFKKDIPRLEKQLDLLIKIKKYLKNYNE